MESREEVRREAEWLRIRGLVSRDGYNGLVLSLEQGYNDPFVFWIDSWPHSHHYRRQMVNDSQDLKIIP